MNFLRLISLFSQRPNKGLANSGIKDEIKDKPSEQACDGYDLSHAFNRSAGLDARTADAVFFDIFHFYLRLARESNLTS